MPPDQLWFASFAPLPLKLDLPSSCQWSQRCDGFAARAESAARRDNHAHALFLQLAVVMLGMQRDTKKCQIIKELLKGGVGVKAEHNMPACLMRVYGRMPATGVNALARSRLHPRAQRSPCRLHLSSPGASSGECGCSAGAE